MKKSYIFVFSIMFISMGIFSTSAQIQSFNPPIFKPLKGYIPDAETAIRVAVAVWEPIYGKQQIQGQSPYKAKLSDGVWTVTGSLPEDKTIIDENGQELVIVTVGGVALIEIVKDTGCILRVTHGE